MIRAVLLCALVASVASQDKLTIATVEPSNPTIGPPDFCLKPVFTATTAQQRQEIDIGERLEAGTATVDEAKKLIILPPQPPRIDCEDGPKIVIHTVPNEFHWPIIRKGSCDNLPGCKVPPCFPRKTVWRSKCVQVYKLINGKWVNIGYRIRRYLDHLSCECKQCKHILSQKECVSTYPCPNSDNTCSFCYWIPSHYIAARQAPAVASETSFAPVPFPAGRCACCAPTCCDAPKQLNYDNCRCECPNRIRCPPGQFFSEDTCKCECPKGSKFVNGKCIGDCSDIDLAWCSNVHCTDNQHFKCKRQGYQCVCPSCDGADPAWCTRTKCLEQPRNPKCVLDSYSNKCRCPQCSDQKDYRWCVMTSCGPYNNTPCRWEAAWKKCLCPH